LLYITDPTPNQVGSSTWQSDCVELFFAMDVKNSDTYRPGDWQIRKLASKTQAAGGVDGSSNIATLLADANFKVVQKDGGPMVQEWQIPINTLVETANFNGSSFRFDIQLSDNDGTGNERTGHIYWNSTADDQWTRIQNQGMIYLKAEQPSLEVPIEMGSTWRFFKGKTAPSVEWINPSFDDLSWTASSAPFRFGDGTGGIELTDMLNNYTSIFLRKTFTVNMPDSLISECNATMVIDDGYKIWLNGKEITSYNIPLSVKYNSLASSAVEMQTISNSFKIEDVGLKNGQNTICVQVLNCSLTSSDLYFDMMLTLNKKLPKAPEVKFSKPGGYYNAKFNVTLSGGQDGDTIKYTLDSSDPQTSSTAILAVSPVTIVIDPDDNTRIVKTPGIVVRAVVQKTGYNSGNPESRTYLFLEKVKTQVYPGGTWPSSAVNNQIMDYDVNQSVVSQYSSDFSKAFTTIPTVCLVTDNIGLFDASQGMYVNALNHGESWEKAASIELINTDNTEAFASGIGLRIRGGWSRHPDNPKHAFRVFFKDKYGKKKLKYPIFGEDAAQTFDKFDLRCAQNYSWSYYHDNMLTYAQDETCRDIQGLMGHTYTRSRYCQLFLNGMYWGLYEFMERPEANFAESYKGGDKDDYDVIKVATDNSSNLEATDGNMDAYQRLYSFTQSGFTADAAYYKLQGLDKTGNIDTTLEKLVDIDNLIDYMLNIFYSGNFDAPLSEFGGNNQPNNFYAIKNRNSKREGFFFIVHDAEHTFNYISGSQENNNSGVQENRVSLENDGMSSPSSYLKFTPQWLHHRLKSNAKYRLRFADRAVKYLYNDGLLTASQVEKVFKARTNQINMAIIGESARWGDSKSSYDNSHTKDNAWIPAVNNTVSKFIKLRTPIVIQQLKDAGLLPKTDIPVVKQDGKAVSVNKVEISKPIKVTFENPNVNGKIVVSTDGNDPMNIDGTQYSSATTFANGEEMDISSATIVKARIKTDTEWSPLREVIFTNKANRENIRITEIQYNPAATASFGSKSMEFIEFKNIGTTGIDLSGCRIDSAVKYTFPEGSIIAPGKFVVIAADITAFESTYLKAPTGRFSGNLANEGERVILYDESNTALIDFTYKPDWVLRANETGFSLVAKSKTPDTKPEAGTTYWKGSVLIGGSPFADDEGYIPPSEIETSKITCSIYPNPASSVIKIEAMGSNFRNLKMVDLQGRTIYNENLRSDRISMSLNLQQLQVSQGIYFIVLKNDKEMKVQKVVVK